MKKWLYFLVDEQGRSYKSVNGVVSKVSQPTPLPYSPDGWQDINIGYERNLNRFGIVRNFSLPLGFVKTANHILRHIVLTGTIETKVFLLIKKLELETTVSDYRFIYRFFYKGELDLSTAELGEEKSTVQIMEGGLSKLLAANEGNTYEFPLDDAEAVEIYADGYTLRTTINYKAIPTEISSMTGPIVYPVSFSSQEGFIDETIQRGDTFFEFLDLPDLVPSESTFLFSKSSPGLFEYRVKGEFKINVTGTDADLKFWFQSHNRGTNINTQSVSIIDVANYVNGEHTIPFDFTITVPSPLVEPEALYIALSFGPGEEFNILTSDFDISFLYRKEPTLVKAFKPSVLYRKLVGKVCEGEQFAQSDILLLNDNLLITCGDALRGLDGAVIKTTLKQFFDSYNAWLNVGIGIDNNKLRLESKEHFFDGLATPFHLGNAKDVKVSYASDLFFNLLKTGYTEHEYEQAYGRFEFNNTTQLTSPITKMVKEFNLISSYRADPTGIELARINLEGKLTTDDNSDNDVFVLNCDIANPNIDGSFNLFRETYDTMLGIPTESQASIFNIEQLTPKRILKTHGNWLRSILYGFETGKLKFQTTQKNRELRTVLAGVTIDEDADEIIGNLTAPLFKPYYIEFNCQSPIGITEALETDPNQPFSFEWEGETFVGFLIKAGIAPDSNKEQTFKLLSAPQNDITKLI